MSASEFANLKTSKSTSSVFCILKSGRGCAGLESLLRALRTLEPCCRTWSKELQETKKYYPVGGTHPRPAGVIYDA